MPSLQSKTTSGYLIRRLEQSPTVPCPCGQSTRAITRADTPRCNLHVTQIKDSVRHYHRRCTEVYFILQGQGRMELGTDTVDVEPGMVIYIEPGTPHRLCGDVRTIVFGVPALEEDDEFFDC